MIIEVETMDELKNLSHKLYELNKQTKIIYTKCRETGIEGDFFNEVKPFADQVKEIVDQWQPLATEWTIYEKPKNIYPIQIKNTAENIQMTSLKAFYPKTSFKKFQDHYQSIDFILKNMIDQLN